MKTLIALIIVTSFTIVAIYNTSDPYGIAEAGVANSVQKEAISIQLDRLTLLGFRTEKSSTFSLGENVQVHIVVNAKTEHSIPVSLYVFKDDGKIISNVSQFVPVYPIYTRDNVTSGDIYFPLNGISDPGRYTIKATILGTNNYAKVTAIFEDKLWYFFINDLLTFQNLKLLAVFLSLLSMISFLLYQIITWNPGKPSDTSEKKSRQVNELVGFILMTIMVFSIISYLSAVDAPIGANTSFGIVSRSDLSPEIIVGGNIPPEVLKSIKKEWILNLGGTAQSLCVDRISGNVTYGGKVKDIDSGGSCYDYINNRQLEPHIIFNGGVQIPLYVPILGFIGAYLRYVYNITLKTIKIKRGKIKEKESIFDSLKDFLHEFLVIILSPIAALALWLFFRQASIVSDLTLALSSITIGLGLEPFIKKLEKWLPDQLEGEKPEGEKPEGEKPEGEKPEGEKPEGEKPEGEKPEGEKPEGEKPEGEKRKK